MHHVEVRRIERCFDIQGELRWTSGGLLSPFGWCSRDVHVADGGLLTLTKEWKDRKEAKERVTAPLCATRKRLIFRARFWNIFLCNRLSFVNFSRWQKLKFFRIKNIFEVSWNRSFSSPIPVAAHCLEHEGRVVVVVGEFKFSFFLFSFQLGFQKPEKVQVKFSAWR